MSSSEFAEWMEFYEICPFGPDRDNIHSAQIASLLYNSSRGKNSKALTTSDFMYVDRKTAQEREEAEFIANLESLAIPQKGDRNGV